MKKKDGKERKERKNSRPKVRGREEGEKKVKKETNEKQ